MVFNGSLGYVRLQTDDVLIRNRKVLICQELGKARKNTTQKNTQIEPHFDTLGFKLERNSPFRGEILCFMIWL